MVSRSSRNLILAMACILAVLVFSGCAIPTDYKMQALMLIESPDKLVYVTGEDMEINLGGGKVRKFQNFGNGYYIEEGLEAFSYDTYEGKYYHSNVNLAEKGTYLVTIAKPRWFSRIVCFQFTVQVVVPQEYKPNIAEGAEKFTSETVDPTYCENVTAVMTSPPANIIYLVGYAGEIDPSGIVVKPAKGWFPKKYDIADLDYTLESDVDFNTPGSYIVKVTFEDEKSREYWFIFTVAVAERAG